MWHFISTWVLGGTCVGVCILILGDVGLSLNLDFVGCGFESTFCFGGVGSLYFKLGFV